MRLFTLALSLSLAACVGPIETRIDSSGETGARLTSFQADEAAAVEALPLVTAALTERGYRSDASGSLSLQVTVSDRPADLALKSGEAMLSPAKGKKRCAKREYRLGVVLTRLSDGVEIYRAHAAEFHCKLTLTEVLPVLVKSALADLGAPRGAYVVNRPRSGEFRLIPAAPG